MSAGSHSSELLNLGMGRSWETAKFVVRNVGSLQSPLLAYS